MTTDADVEAQMAEVERQMQGLIPPAVETETETETPNEPEVEVETEEPVAEGDDIEALARSQGHVSYDEWVSQGKDPKAWRPAEEYVRRGELLKTPKPDLIDRVERLAKAQEEQAKLFAEQIRISREQQERARIAGYEQAIADARAMQEKAFNEGDREAHRQAIQQEREAEQALQRTQTPTQDPELLRWQDQADWFKNGFTVDPYTGQQVPKDERVETFLLFQKEFMLRNPTAKVIDSVKFAEDKVKKAMPEFFRPKTVQQQVRTQQVETGGRPVSRGPDPLAKYSSAEQALIKKAAAQFGIPLKDYIKQMEG